MRRCSAISSASLGPPRRRLRGKENLRFLEEVLMETRDAVAADAPAACQVMRRSIAELCAADHQNDPAIVARWLSNKTPEIFASWPARPDNSLLVAAKGGSILGVGSVTDAGEINLTLN
jgi:hypothetical protein